MKNEEQDLDPISWFETTYRLCEGTEYWILYRIKRGNGSRMSVFEIIRRLWKWRLARVRGEQLNQLARLFHVARSSRKSRVLKA